MSLYFKILFLSFILPFLFSFHSKINFHKKWIPFFKANLITLIPFLIWDEIFTVKKFGALTMSIYQEFIYQTFQ